MSKQSSIADRNRQIKKVLEGIFKNSKVTVRGSKGTAYGYVRAHIAWQPLSWDSAQELRAHCKAALRAAKIDLGSRYTDDTCQTTTDECHVEFEPALYWKVMKHDDGSMSVIRQPWTDTWEHLPATQKDKAA